MGVIQGTFVSSGFAVSRRTGGEAYDVHSVDVDVRHALGEARDQQNADVDLPAGRSQHQRCVMVGVARDAVILVAGVDKEGLMWVMGQFQLLFVGSTFRTAMSVKPSRAARCSEVLLLSWKSGFRRTSGLLRTMRRTSTRSLRRIARRRRISTLIIVQVRK